MSPRSIILFALCISLALLTGCGGAKEPASPTQTFQTFAKAFRSKDITAMKLLLSSESIKMHEQEAKAQGVTLDDIVMRQTLIGANQSVIKFRNEKIEGETATLEVENEFGRWETIPFVFEDGQWKIDTKGYADRFTREIEELNRQMDDAIDRDRQALDPMQPPADPASPSPEPDQTPF